MASRTQYHSWPLAPNTFHGLSHPTTCMPLMGTLHIVFVGPAIPTFMWHGPCHRLHLCVSCPLRQRNCKCSAERVACAGRVHDAGRHWVSRLAQRSSAAEASTAADDAGGGRPALICHAPIGASICTAPIIPPATGFALAARSGQIWTAGSCTAAPGLASTVLCRDQQCAALAKCDQDVTRTVRLQAARRRQHLGIASRAAGMCVV
eukprot:363116-Chlamydomonas_euryale.AAC.13